MMTFNTPTQLFVWIWLPGAIEPVVAGTFLLQRAEAIAVIEGLVIKIGEYWAAVCADAALAETDRNLLASRAFLNPYAFEGLDGDAIHLAQLGEQMRNKMRNPANAL